VILSSLKPAEDGNGIIARVYEIIGSESEFAFGFNKDWKIFETGMDESSDISEAVCGPIVIGPFEVKTFRLLPA
jgi:alpha-mannosidase